MVFVGLVDPVEERLEIPLHDAERRAQLVADVGEQPSSLLLARLEPCAHRIERPRQHADLTRTALRDSRAEVTFSDATGSLDDVAELPRVPAPAAAEPEEQHEPAEKDDRHPELGTRAGHLQDAQHHADRGREQQEEKKEPDHREEDHPAHEAAAHRAPLAALRGERLALRPPPGPLGRRAPPPAVGHYPSLSAKR